MGILTDDMKRVVREQRLGFVATVCPDWEQYWETLREERRMRSRGESAS